MKKFLALTLALVMSLSLVACGSKEETPAEGEETPEGTADFSVAMITDYGDITDQSFNQTTYEACKANMQLFFCSVNTSKILGRQSCAP